MRQALLTLVVIPLLHSGCVYSLYAGACAYIISQSVYCLLWSFYRSNIVGVSVVYSRMHNAYRGLSIAFASGVCL